MAGGAGFLLHHQFSFVWDECKEAGLSKSVAFLGVCSHTLEIGDTVEMGTLRSFGFFADSPPNPLRRILLPSPWLKL